MERIRVIIMGAAGRDFHVFNTCFRNDASYQVVAFTAAQIPNISGRDYPAELAGPLYPAGIPVWPEAELPSLIAAYDVRQVIFAYSDISHLNLMHIASAILAAGADFRLAGPLSTMLHATKPVISVCAVRTGAGKSQTTRYITSLLQEKGKRIVVVRHPMPYGDLLRQRCQRFATLADLDLQRCSIEEREEYEPHLNAGTVVYAGVDYEAILEEAQQEADILVWDGGNNDFPFYQPNFHIVVADPLRPGHEISYHPGETNLRMAAAVIINKTNIAAVAAISEVEDNCRRMAPQAAILHAASILHVENESLLQGKRVLVIEDGPSLTHGELPYGAGVIAAQQYGAQIIDAKPFAVGSLRDTYAAFPHLEQALPAMGYGSAQLADLSATIENCPCDLILSATPIDLRRVLSIAKPLLRVRYDLKEVSGPSLSSLLERFF
ncbi:cyclic 2,3-diphosphoglycerate synthase [Azotosporobacter soli]|uniref:cyclic 2,3-diphosphoglycerate synthase n=1 Tax=Azotosporobacter soli TaxID=3055040 RepID=UPI0031FED7E4